MATPIYKVYKDDAERAKVYQNRVSSARSIQDEWKPSAIEAIDRYRMRHRGRSTPKGHEIRSTTALGVLDTMFSNLTAVNVTFLLDNLANGTPLQSKIAQKAVQDAWNEQKAKKKADKGVKDGVLAGIGFTKVFYEYAEVDKTVGRSEEDIEADVDRLFDEADAAGVEPPSSEMIPNLIPLTEEVTEVVRDRAVVEFCKWDEVLWDYNAGDWEECRWVAHVKRVQRHDLEGDPEIRAYLGAHWKRKLDRIAADHTLDDKYMQGRKATIDDEHITIIEMWDLEAGDVVTLPIDGDVILKKKENCFGFHDDLEDRNPFCAIIPRRDPTDVRGISDMEVLRYLIDEEEVYRVNLATYIERLKPKIAGPAEALGPAGEKAMASSEWGVYVPLDDAGGSDIMQIQFPQMPSEAFGMIDRIKNEAREATGVNEFMRGLFTPKRTTATEVNAVDDHSTGRHSEKLNALEEYYVNISRRLLWIIQRYYDEERVLRIAGVDPEDPEAGAEETIWDWTAEDIAAELDIRIELAPKEQITQDSKRQLAMWVLETYPLIEDVDKKEVLQWAGEQVGLDPKVSARFLKTDAESQQAMMAELQRQAAEVQAADGTVPDPASVPGPMPADELAAAVNSGEVPPEMAPIPTEEV